MRWTGMLLLVGTTLLGAETIPFGPADSGEPPDGWQVTMTNRGRPPKWEILSDPSAPSPPFVLAQTSSDPTSGRFPLAVYESRRPRDGEVEVRFRPLEGERDRAAGIVWRYQDESNYYIVRANALENNVVLYKVQNGKRSSLAPKGRPAGTYGVKHTVPSGTWSRLGVTFVGSTFTVRFNGEVLFEVEDGSFPQPGRVGLWTKADSVTYFDDFRFEER